MKAWSYSEKTEHRETRSQMSITQSVQGGENCVKAVKKLIKCIKQKKKVSDELLSITHAVSSP